MDKPQPPTTAPTDPYLDLAERHLQMLRRLSEMGMDIAKATQQQAKAALAAGDMDTACEFADAFTGLFDEVRRIVALQDKIARDVRARHQAVEAERASRAVVTKPTVTKAANTRDNTRKPTEATIIHWPIRPTRH
jgi:vacuolar-type H+-ATPase subunit F/Vma7